MHTPYYTEADLRRAGREETQLMRSINDLDARLQELEPGGEGNGDEDFPDGYTFDRSGSWYTVYDPDGEEVGNVQGRQAAHELAQEHADGEG